MKRQSVVVQHDGASCHAGQDTSGYIRIHAAKVALTRGCEYFQGLLCCSQKVYLTALVIVKTHQLIMLGSTTRTAHLPPTQASLDPPEGGAAMARARVRASQPGWEAPPGGGEKVAPGWVLPPTRRTEHGSAPSLHCTSRAAPGVKLPVHLSQAYRKGVLCVVFGLASLDREAARQLADGHRHRAKPRARGW